MLGLKLNHVSKRGYCSSWVYVCQLSKGFQNRADRWELVLDIDIPVHYESQFFVVFVVFLFCFCFLLGFLCFLGGGGGGGGGGYFVVVSTMIMIKDTAKYNGAQQEPHNMPIGAGCCLFIGKSKFTYTCCAIIVMKWWIHWLVILDCGISRANRIPSYTHTHIERPVSCLNIDGLVQERRNSSALSMEMHLSRIEPSLCGRGLCLKVSLKNFIFVLLCCM